MLGGELDDLIFWDSFGLKRDGLYFFGVHIHLFCWGDVVDWILEEEGEEELRQMEG